MGALPLVAAKCNTTNSSSTNNKEDDKNNKDDNKNNSDGNANTNSGSGNQNGEQGGGSTTPENNQGNSSNQNGSNNSATTPDNGNANSSDNGASRPGEGTAPKDGETGPKTTKEPKEPKTPRESEGSQPSDQGRTNTTPGGGSGTTQPGNGGGTNHTDLPMADQPNHSNSPSGNTETPKSKEEKLLELLYKFFSGYAKIEEQLKYNVKLTELKNKFHSTYGETINNFDRETEKFLEKFGYKKEDIDDLTIIFDDVTNLTSPGSNEANQKFTKLFEKVKTKLSKAYEEYSKKK